MKRKFALALTIMLSSSLLFACSPNQQKAEEKPAQNTEQKMENNMEDKKDEKASDQKASEEVSLKDWEGMWNSISGYIDKEEVQQAYQNRSKNEGREIEEIKTAYKALRKSDFLGFKVEGDTITMYDKFESEGGKPIGSAEYKFTDKKEVEHGGEALEWDIFTAVSPDAKYPVIMLMPVHGEEAVIHFHMRYGNNVDELMAKEDWLPTFVKPETTAEALIEELSLNE